VVAREVRKRFVGEVQGNPRTMLSHILMLPLFIFTLQKLSLCNRRLMKTAKLPLRGVSARKFGVENFPARISSEFRKYLLDESTLCKYVIRRVKLRKIRCTNSEAPTCDSRDMPKNPIPVNADVGLASFPSFIPSIIATAIISLVIGYWAGVGNSVFSFKKNPPKKRNAAASKDVRELSDVSSEDSDVDLTDNGYSGEEHKLVMTLAFLE
jgi:hypothetical protein